MIRLGDKVISRTARFIGRAEVFRIQRTAGISQAVVEIEETGDLEKVPLADLERVDDLAGLLKSRRFDSPARFDLRTAATFLETEQRRTGVLGLVRIDLLPHQILTAARVLEADQPNHFLADDVGLGKTIEVGLILSSLRARGEANRVLILTPAGLTVQWQEQLEDLFGVYFDVFNRDFFDTRRDAWDRHPRVIASLDAVKRKSRRSVLETAAPWDVLVVDEAHKLTARRDRRGYEDRTQNYELVRLVRDRFETLLFASGTPHQGDDERFALLLKLLRPDLYEDADSLELNRGVLREVVTRNRKSEVTDDQGTFLFQDTITLAEDVTLPDAEQEFLASLEHYIRTTWGEAERLGGRRARFVGFMLAAFGKLAASSPPAILATLRRRRARLVGAPAEGAKSGPAAEGDERFEGEIEEAEAAEWGGDTLFEGEIATLDRLVAQAATLGRGAKADALMTCLRQLKSQPDFSGGLLIFTEYRATQAMLVELLGEAYPDERISTIHGGLGLDGKRAAVKVFTRDGGFLVSTEAGGEGLNLHHNCHVMANFDLPWNPMRLMQRIGRLSRYGQERQVVVLNLRNRGSTDERILAYLDRKIEAVMRLMSAVQDNPEDLRATVLGELSSELDLGSVYVQALATPDGVERSEDEIDRALERVREAAERTAELFGSLDRFDLDEYEDARPEAGVGDVERFVRAFLKEHSRRLLEPEPGPYRFKTPEIWKGERGILDEYHHVVFDRAALDEAPDADLMAFGHAVFDRMVARVREFDFTGYVCKRAVTDERHAGIEGLQLNYQLVITRAGRRHERFLSVFVDSQGAVRPEVATAIRSSWSAAELTEVPSFVDDPWIDRAFEAAGEHAEAQLASYRKGGDDEVANFHAVNAAVVHIRPPAGRQSVANAPPADLE